MSHIETGRTIINEADQEIAALLPTFILPAFNCASKIDISPSTDIVMDAMGDTDIPMILTTPILRNICIPPNTPFAKQSIKSLADAVNKRYIGSAYMVLDKKSRGITEAFTEDERSIELSALIKNIEDLGGDTELASAFYSSILNITASLENKYLNQDVTSRSKNPLYHTIEELGL